MRGPTILPAVRSCTFLLATLLLATTTLPADESGATRPLIAGARADIRHSLMNGRPPDFLPPGGVAAFTQPTTPPQPGSVDLQAGTYKKLSDIPSYTWCYGCANTAAAMVFGYYDRHGYPNMYTHATGDGVCPLYNEEAWPDNLPSVTHGESPLAASHMGIENRTTFGHVDDFWYDYGSPYDPCFDAVTPWDPHQPWDCTGDFMWTNRADKLNYDGDTYFFWSSLGYPDRDHTDNEPQARDGGHGMKLFAQDRGYTVSDVYNQLIMPTPPGQHNYRGFEFADYVEQIDAGRPVLLLVGPHVLVGYGYDTRGGKEDCLVRTTWDNDKSDSHAMAWGGKFAGEDHFAVTVLELAPAPADYRPDLLIQAPASGGYTGGNDYGVTQIALGPTMPGATSTYNLRIRNNGNRADAFKLTGTAGNAKWTVKYRGLAGQDITTAMTGAGWTSPSVPAGSWVDITLQVTPGATAAPNELLGTLITAASTTNTTRTDFVTAWTRKLSADINEDGNVDSRDYGAFTKCWADAASGGAVDLRGDLTGDGQVDHKDADRFTQLLVSGK